MAVCICTVDMVSPASNITKEEGESFDLKGDAGNDIRSCSGLSTEKCTLTAQFREKDIGSYQTITSTTAIRLVSGTNSKDIIMKTSCWCGYTPTAQLDLVCEPKIGESAGKTYQIRIQATKQLCLTRYSIVREIEVPEAFHQSYQTHTP